ncbi:MAG TPA: BON domain-containing protein [Xanthomonadales bacterium]|nr:BON domain-containing protein [Xanthomonadales bacterium]
MTSIRIILVALVLALVSGCAAVAVGTAAVAGHDRRSFWTVVDDQNIELSAYDVINKDKELALRHNVEVIVYNGVLLLVGQVSNEEMKSRAEGYVRDFAGVKRVVNEIEIGPLKTVGQGMKDKYLTSRVKTALFDIVDLPGFDASRVNVTTENGSVYLMGLVTAEEADRVVEIARNVPEVLRVVKVFDTFVPPPAAG